MALTPLTRCPEPKGICHARFASRGGPHSRCGRNRHRRIESRQPPPGGTVGPSRTSRRTKSKRPAPPPPAAAPAPAAESRIDQLKELWLLVEEIAESPAVTDAITQQGFGFADEVAGGMRARSRNADAWLERTARRALRRPPR